MPIISIIRPPMTLGGLRVSGDKDGRSHKSEPRSTVVTQTVDFEFTLRHVPMYSSFAELRSIAQLRGSANMALAFESR